MGLVDYSLTKMADNSAVVDTGALYNKLNSQLEELKGLLQASGGSSVVPVPDVPAKKKRAKPNLSTEQIQVLKDRLVKAREAKKAKRMKATA